MLIVSRQWEGPDALEVPVLRKLYLGRRGRIDGHRVRWFDLPAGDAVRQGLARTVVRMTDAELEEYWIEQALTGGALPPREVGSPEEMVEAVASRRWALGYLGVGTFSKLRPSGVRILGVRMDGRALRPGDAGYPLVFHPREDRAREAAGASSTPGDQADPPPQRFMRLSWRSAMYPLREREAARGAGGSPGEAEAPACWGTQGRFGSVRAGGDPSASGGRGR